MQLWSNVKREFCSRSTPLLCYFFIFKQDFLFFNADFCAATSTVQFLAGTLASHKNRQITEITALSTEAQRSKTRCSASVVELKKHVGMQWRHQKVFYFPSESKFMEGEDTFCGAGFLCWWHGNLLFIPTGCTNPESLPAMLSNQTASQHRSIQGHVIFRCALLIFRSKCSHHTCTETLWLLDENFSVRTGLTLKNFRQVFFSPGEDMWLFCLFVFYLYWIMEVGWLWSAWLVSEEAGCCM